MWGSKKREEKKEQKSFRIFFEKNPSIFDDSRIALSNW